MLCTVRECVNSEQRFCFELISPNHRSYTLQAESEKDMKDWIQVFQNCTEHLLTRQEEKTPTYMKRMSVASFQRHQDDSASLHSELRKINDVCVDCGARG